jgi:hypothetical protein
MAALVGAVAGPFSKSKASIGPFNPCPRGHRILALSSGPSVDLIVYRYSTSAGSPQRTAPCLSMYAGQSRNITLASIGNPPFPLEHCRADARTPARQGRDTPRPAPDREGTLVDSEHRTAPLIHLGDGVGDLFGVINLVHRHRA